jgi:hypothetical protein
VPASIPQTGRFAMAHIVVFLEERFRSASLNLALDRHGMVVDIPGVAGGVLVSTWKMRQRRHAEDGSLASLIIGPKQNC